MSCDSFINFKNCHPRDHILMILQLHLLLISHFKKVDFDNLIIEAIHLNCYYLYPHLILLLHLLYFTNHLLTIFKSFM